MRSPSPRVMNQPCAVYPAVRGQDTTGGVQFTNSDAASSLLTCSAQPHEYEEVYENDRLTQLRHWRLMFATEPGLLPRDKVTWSDPAGVSHTGFVLTSRDEAGRGAAYTVKVVEKL